MTLIFRNITTKDYVFTAQHIDELQVASESPTVKINNGTVPATLVTFNLKTYTGYDFLKWTELVRIIYYSKPPIISEFKGGLLIYLFRVNINPANRLERTLTHH